MKKFGLIHNSGKIFHGVDEKKRNKKRVACYVCTLHLKIVTYLSFSAENNND